MKIFDDNDLRNRSLYVFLTDRVYRGEGRTKVDKMSQKSHTMQISNSTS